MNLRELERLLNNMTDGMDDAVGQVETAATKAQSEIYKALLAEINKFEVSDGRFVVGQDYTKRLAIITKKINVILWDVYRPAIGEYLGHYATIDDITLSLHKSYNELVIDKQKLTPARRTVYDQAEYFLTDGLADAYIQPAKFLLMQIVTTGSTIKQGESILRNWDSGELPNGSKLATSRPTPRLQAYAGQISSDAMFQYYGTIQKIIIEEYKLTKGLYIGDIIKDSRPACKYLVGLKRKIDIKEIPQVLIKYPDGIIPGTTMQNFPVYRCGYRCRHTWMPVRD